MERKQPVLVDLGGKAVEDFLELVRELRLVGWEDQGPARAKESLVGPELIFDQDFLTLHKPAVGALNVVREADEAIREHVV